MIDRDLIINPEDIARVQSFARQAAALTPEAWDRIAARCGVLDHHTFDAFLGRLELAARANTPAADPYNKPLNGAVMGGMGVVWTLLHETAARLPRFGATSGDHSRMPPGLRASCDIEDIALKQQPAHPGVAAALRIVGRALSVYSKSVPDRFDVIYAPFEPEIPLTSLAAPESAATA